MREDMAKVIIERPRYGSWMRARHRKGYHRQQQRIKPEDQPKREGIAEPYRGNRKNLSENLAPLRRFLQSNVGRPWDKVFSEICARINRNSAVQDHVRDHVWDFVALHVVLIDGLPCYGTGRRYSEPLGTGWRWPPFYVCPRSGLLKRVRVRRPKRREPVASPKPIPVGKSRFCVWLDGGWHLAEVEPFPAYFYRDRLYLDPTAQHDVLLGPITRHEAKRHYGREVYAVTVRRLRQEELKHLPIPFALRR